MSTKWYRRELDLGDRGEDVKIVQKKVGSAVTGVYDDATAARVRGVEKTMGRKKQTGVVDAEVAAKLGEKATVGQVPDWFGTDEQDQRVRDILGLSMLEPLDEAVRRCQSENGMELTGRVTSEFAVWLADRSA